MVYTSQVFLFLFLPATLAAYFLFRGRTMRNAVLFIASFFFYSWGEPLYVVLLIISIILNWGLSLLLAQNTPGRRCILIAGAGINVAGIGVFKYAAFLSENLEHILGVHLPVPDLSLPIGISFYTFHAISYLVDVYRSHAPAPKNPFLFGTYMVLFPKLIAGPIVRYKQIEAEIVSRRENLEGVTQGLRRFAMGFGKKVLIANTMASIADKILSTGPYVGAIPAWIGFSAYTFQIYFDFSGYSDMAIGLGRMFGFQLPENFNYPYAARSVTEFWRRWHMSLSAFFRDYVYFPLGGSRVSRGRWVFNLTVVWGITGLWHGANWNFVLWGLYYGVLLACEKLFLRVWTEKAPRMLQHAFVICSFLFGWILFRIEDFSLIGGWLGSMVGTYGWGHPVTLNALNILHKYPWFIIAAVGSTPMARDLFKRAYRIPLGSLFVDLLTGAIFVWSILEVSLGSFSPFIYFQF